MCSVMDIGLIIIDLPCVSYDRLTRFGHDVLEFCVKTDHLSNVFLIVDATCFFLGQLSKFASFFCSPLDD